MTFSMQPMPQCRRPDDRPDTLFQLARLRGHAQPDRVGFTFLVDGETEEQNLTYGELDRRARAIAGRIQEVCRAGERVLLLYGPGLDYIAALFGCQYAGVIPVPAYPPDPLRAQRTLSRLQAIMTDCEATLALGSAKDLGAFGSLLASNLGQDRVIATDEWASWTSRPWTAPESQPDDLALLQYTSGSTDTPRGVMVTHRNIWSLFEDMRVVDHEQTVGVGWLPLYHDMGLIGGILTPFYFGRRAVLMSPLAFVQRPLRWLLAISRYRGTTTGAPNFAFDLCVSKFSSTEAGDLDLSSLELIITGAEPIRSETLDRFSKTFAPYGLRPDVWRPCYGLAEATLGVTGIRFGHQLAKVDFSLRELEQNRAVPMSSAQEPCRRLVGCGWGLQSTEVIVVDPSRHLQLAEGQVGEIWIRGPHVARGYWNRHEETDSVFQTHLADSGHGPFLRTGDLGFYHEGQLFLTGRMKELMIFWGRNVYPQDVEQTSFACHPLLKENASAAFAIDVDGQEQLVVVQEVLRPRKIDLDAIADSIRQAIQSEHHVPLYALVFLKAGTLPKTSSGKIQRHVARELFLSNDLDVVRQWQFPVAVHTETTSPEKELPSRESIRHWLVARIARHCNVTGDQINPDEALTRYVMDSVSAVTIAVELQQWLGRSISPVILFDSPSLAVLAERLADPESYRSDVLPNVHSVDQLPSGELDQALARLLKESTSP